MERRAALDEWQESYTFRRAEIPHPERNAPHLYRKEPPAPKGMITLTTFSSEITPSIL